MNQKTEVDDRHICKKTFPSRNLVLNDICGE
jgi:hypothetical protein